MWAQATSQIFSNPYSPFAYTPISRRLAAGYDLLHRLGKHYEKPEFGLRSTNIDGAEVPITEEVVIEKPFCRLLHFRREFESKSGAKGKRNDPTVLIVAPLSGHHATLLRDTVRTLLPNHDVYITDWINARLVPISAGPFHLDDYVDYVIEFIRAPGPGRARHFRVPADGAGTRRSFTDGKQQGSEATENDDDDGRSHRPAPQSDAGQRARDAQEPALV